MLPFIHLGPLELGTFGILVALAAIVGYFVLRADLRRRRLPEIADTIVLVTAVAGMVGAKIYHLVQFPDEFHAMLNSGSLSGALDVFRSGFAWAGGMIAGVLALFWLAYKFKISTWTMFDVVSPAAALGYGIGRIGCLISGDGDYGVPTNGWWGIRLPDGLVQSVVPVQPTPIYEFLISILICWFLWRLGESAARRKGEVVAQYFIWTGVARFLVEFIRINPGVFWAPLWLQNFVNAHLRIAQNLGIDSELVAIHNPRFTGFSNAQMMAVASALIGCALVWYVRSRQQPETARRGSGRNAKILHRSSSSSS